MSWSSSSASNFNPIYLRMRDLTRDLCAQGIAAVESIEKIREKFGDQAPTQCTIYKWRREFRGGKVYFYNHIFYHKLLFIWSLEKYSEFFTSIEYMCKYEVMRLYSENH